MHFDDRLATVLRNRATGERSARTQFRQLIDLLGERPQGEDRALRTAAYLRLIALGELLSVRERTALVGEAGWRFRNPELVRWFGDAHPHIAAAALARAQLSGEEWMQLIPNFPIQARGFLRNRKDLPELAVAVLDRLGVSDRALPKPQTAKPQSGADEFEPLPAPPAPVRLVRSAADILRDAGSGRDRARALSGFQQTSEGIRALVERIEKFKRSRLRGLEIDKPSEASDAPHPDGTAAHPLHAIAFRTDRHGVIDWANAAAAPMVVGMDLAGSLDLHAGAAATVGAKAVRARPTALRGAAAIAGSWILDASPRIARDGRLEGYIGRLRRVGVPGNSAREKEADRLRQLLHELRTPVNAMQGYAEIIQQQMVGPVPHEYRAIAAGITGDAARILAGFDELDRLARLESGAVELEAGEADFAAIVRTQVAQLQTVLSPRVARIDAAIDRAGAPVALASAEGERIAWRFLASLAGPMAAGERIALDLSTIPGDRVALTVALPTALRAAHDAFAAELRAAASPLSSGIFGAGFSLRLARAEVRAAGGELRRDGNRMVLTLPLARSNAANLAATGSRAAS